jgi:hypothetical protein
MHEATVDARPFFIERGGRRFESVRGLCKSAAARRRFLVHVDLLLVERAVGMEPFMELSRSRGAQRIAGQR